MTTDTDWARSAFALGYAEFGEFPVPPGARATCRAACESASPAVGHLILEAGRTEGKRSSREARYRRLYRWHADELAKALAPILARTSTDELAHRIVDTAASQAAAESDPVTRRRAVAGVAAAAITAQVHAQDRLDLDTLNAGGWAHASAYGTAEGHATPAKGGPPTPAKIAAGATAALARIADTLAQDAASGWTDQQIRSLAMAAAMKAGDGSGLDAAVRAVKASLGSADAATATYGDQLHAAVIRAFVGTTQANTPGVLYDYVTADDPCDECEDNEAESPYDALDLPDIPVHPNCLCSIEVSTSSPALVEV